MDWESVFKLITAALASVGGATVIILGVSSKLGKFWAQKILEQEKSKLASELETTKRELDLAKDKLLSTHNDKVAIYRMVIDTVAEILSTFDAWHEREISAKESQQAFQSFNRNRIKLYGYIGMLAPQNVMDAQDRLIDHLLLVHHQNAPYDWREVRKLAIALINEVRKDMGIDTNPISYNGVL
ncbi:hypothetical protein ACTNIH_004742 [Vibrio parahaemolyticus]|nr:hypothetical protein [Vibrio parahaemolyticus]EJN2405908.1 hypothetical protein [Vibrio parahaemolyticus]EJU9794645.1 hypothetical protein [Vibrio parahaemolyticus]ELA8070690.1 hypothetical protein [Vibrio parahaemolyticus]ELU7468684.1 hypothetical protein [Vibrio parahaemolyticus]